MFRKYLSLFLCSADTVLQSVLAGAAGRHWLAVGEPVVNMLTVGPAVRETFMTFGTLEGFLSAVKSLVFC